MPAPRLAQTHPLMPGATCGRRAHHIDVSGVPVRPDLRRALLLGVLYLSFISLGLPDTLLGVAWPEMRLSFGKSLEAGGILLALTTVISVCASLASGIVTARRHTGVILAVCAALTASAMLGYATAPSWTALLLCTLLFGIGQGAVDTAVNAYMAKHYAARHMQWVHACWGLGATAGPLIMSTVFALDATWRTGYLCVAGIQASLTVVFFLSLPLWRNGGSSAPDARPTHAAPPVPATPAGEAGARAAATAGVLFYLLYPGVEIVTGLWGASYMVERLGAPVETAAGAITLFWGSLTAGRVGAGLAASRLGNAGIIRCGCALAFLGILCAWSADGPGLFRIGAALIGLGLGPLYPSMMHDTPARVGAALADRVIGFQVGAALAGAMILPPLAGWLAGRVSLAVFCPVQLTFLTLVAIAHETSFRLSKRR